MIVNHEGNCTLVGSEATVNVERLGMVSGALGMAALGRLKATEVRELVADLNGPYFDPGVTDRILDSIDEARRKRLTILTDLAIAGDVPAQQLLQEDQAMRVIGDVTVLNSEGRETLGLDHALNDELLREEDLGSSVCEAAQTILDDHFSDAVEGVNIVAYQYELARNENGGFYLPNERQHYVAGLKTNIDGDPHYHFAASILSEDHPARALAAQSQPSPE